VFSREVARVHAVDDVSFRHRRARRSGSSGSRVRQVNDRRTILRLVEPTGAKCGSGADVTALDKRALRRSARRCQIIFQDPYAP